MRFGCWRWRDCDSELLPVVHPAAHPSEETDQNPEQEAEPNCGFRGASFACHYIPSHALPSIPIKSDPIQSNQIQFNPAGPSPSTVRQFTPSTVRQLIPSILRQSTTTLQLIPAIPCTPDLIACSACAHSHVLTHSFNMRIRMRYLTPSRCAPLHSTLLIRRSSHTLYACDSDPTRPCCTPPNCILLQR